MYVLTLNVTDGIDGVTVQNMAEQNVGCLHDYQLQTRDMVTLEGADALVINGGGMEQFMDKVLTLRADLPVIDASEGIAMFPATRRTTTTRMRTTSMTSTMSFTTRTSGWIRAAR